MDDSKGRRYRGKRFLTFLIAVLALFGAYFVSDDAAIFASYTNALWLMYGAYLTGQSATDYVKTKNGNQGN